MKRVPHKVEVSEVMFKRLMSEFLETTHGTINKGNEKLRKLIFMRMNETEKDAKERKKRMAEMTNKVDDMVKTLGKDTDTEGSVYCALSFQQNGNHKLVHRLPTCEAQPKFCTNS